MKKVRDLICDKGNEWTYSEDAKKEVNILRISNLDDFLNEFGPRGNKRAHYRSPFGMLAELEKTILFQNDPPKALLISYKDDGEAIFDLIGVYIEYENEHDKLGYRVVEYQFTTTIS